MTDIALQPGEQLVSVSAGDTVRWIIGDTESGSGADKRVHVLVKPSRADLRTNLVINTDRRSYHLELSATPGTWLASVAWEYPQDLVRTLRCRAFEPAGLLRIAGFCYLRHPGVECGKNRLMVARERRGAAAASEQGRGHIDRIAHQIAIFEQDQAAVDILRLERHRTQLREVGADVAGVAEIFDQPHLRRGVADDMRPDRTGGYLR